LAQNVGFAKKEMNETDLEKKIKSYYWMHGMTILANKIDERVEAVYFTRDSIVVHLMDGRTISAPIAWYPKLLKATSKQRSNWEICGGGYGIHWPNVDEDLSTEGLLRGARSPTSFKKKSVRRSIKSAIRRKVKSRTK
jgi:hypothetical protein